MAAGARRGPGTPARVVGLVLAAGAGTRMGRPKALVRDGDDRPWIDRAVAALLDGGCPDVVVVLGAAADEARPLVPDLPSVSVVEAPAWGRGLGASLAAGLAALDGTTPDEDTPDAALVTLVDLPGLPSAAVRRVLGPEPSRPDTLRRAVFGGRPGHPVLIGRGHWAAIRDGLDGDQGAGEYLRTHGATAVECGDLWDGADQDRPAQTGR